MTSRKNSDKGFTSFRVIGKKAQDLLIKASKEINRRKTTESHKHAALPRNAQQPHIQVRFSILSVAQAALVILLIIVSAWSIWQITDKIILVLLSFFLAAIIDPSVRVMEKWGVPRGIAVLIHFFLALFIFLFLVLSIIPIIAQQLQDIANLLNEKLNALMRDETTIWIPFLSPEASERLGQLLKSTLQNLSITNMTDALQRFGNNLSSVAQGLFVAGRIATSVASFFVNLIVVLAFAFFIQIEKESMRSWFRSFFSASYKHYMDDKAEAVHLKIGQWARGQLTLAFAIGILVYIALKILQMPYAATLAVLAGMTEFIPYIGPLIAAVPSVLIALTEGGFLWASIVAGVYYVVQWCENNLLVPLIMKRAVGVSPVAIMFSMLVGVSFPQIIHPILGLLLAVPVTTIILLFVEDWRAMRQKKQ